MLKLFCHESEATLNCHRARATADTSACQMQCEKLRELLSICPIELDDASCLLNQSGAEAIVKTLLKYARSVPSVAPITSHNVGVINKGIKASLLA